MEAKVFLKVLKMVILATRYHSLIIDRKTLK